MQSALKPVKGWQACLATLLVLLVCGTRSFGQTASRYFYDDSDQLGTVIDASGNQVVYVYDAAGNIVSVVRSSASASTALAILGFTPQSGAIGSSVTIQGQNFSTTPSSNAVTFNGVAATVVSATSTTLVATVPSTGTTGPIAVSVNGATATSISSYTVVASPAVLSVAPRFAVSSAAGTTIPSFSVTGANLTGATFSFTPAFSPASIVVKSATIDPSGNSATLSLSVAAGVKGTFTLVATNAAGASSSVVTTGNTLQIIDPDGDADGDGLSNAVEIAIGTDPLNPQTSGSGLPDGWQVFYGFNPLDPTVAGQTPNKSGKTVLQDFQQGLNPRNPNLVPPAVTQVTPANNATGVYVNSVVVLRFGEPLQVGISQVAAQAAITAALGSAPTLSAASQTTAALTLQGYMNRTCCGNTVIPGTVTLTGSFGAISGGVTASSDGLSVTFSPSQPLSSNTAYSLSANGVRDSAGNLMTTAFTSLFTTGAAADGSAPTIKLVDPENNSTGVPTNVHYTVQFSKAMDPATLTTGNFSIVDQITNVAVPGSIQVDATGMTASFIPSPSLAIARGFTVNLGIGLKDIDGNNLASQQSYYFTTGYADETAPPHMVSTSPLSGASGIPVNALIDLQFSQPLNITTVVPNIQVLAGGQPIAVQMALSSGDERVTITPVSGLQANTQYTVSVGAGITNIAGTAVDNPGTFSFQTAALVEKTTLTIVSEDPPNNATGIPLNATIRVGFNKAADATTLGAGSIQLAPSAASGSLVAGATTVSSDATSATFIPSANLVSQTQYCFSINGVVDLEGQALSGSGYRCFTTGSSTQTAGPTVVAVSPANASAGVPVNATVQVSLNEPVSTVSVTNSAITVTSGGQPVAGTVTVGSGGTSLIFTPSNSLSVNATYTVTVGGFSDLAGDPATAFTSGFATGGSSTIDTTGPTVVSVSPANQATGVAVTTPVVVTFSEALNPISINGNSINIQANGQTVAGTYAVSGAVVTFTPSSPLPGGATVRVYVVSSTYPQDVAGNNSNSSNTSFTTAATADTTVPTILMVNPANGATGVGLNAQVVVTFSKSMNPATLNSTNIAVLVAGSRVSFNSNVSADNQTVVLSNLNIPASTVVTLAISHGVTDLSGNALADFTSQFTTAAAFDTTRASVVTQRPANGATGVAISASPVVLFVNKQLNTGSVSTAMHVSQNGQIVAGTVAVVGNGQTIEFTPTVPWAYGALVQVFLDPTALDLSGNPVNAFSGSFTVVGDPTATAPTVVNYSPANGATGIPLNVIPGISYNETLDPTTIIAANVYLNGPNGTVTSMLALDSTATVVHLTPAAALTAGAQYCFYSYGVTGTNGKAAQNLGHCFTAGTAAQTSAPKVVTVSPADKLTGVPLNANVGVQFSGTIDPLTVSGTTIQISGGGQTAVPSSISFSSNNTVVQITPQAPLPPSTVMTITIAGVADLAGNVVATSTTSFTTGTAPATAAPGFIASNPVSGATSVPLNAPLSLQSNTPVSGTSVNLSTFQVYDNTVGSYVNGTYSLSADSTTVYFVPATPFGAGRNYSVYFTNYGMTDLAGNSTTASCSGCLNNFSFVTGFGSTTTIPQVTGIAPATAATNVPLNAQIEVAFNEPVNAEDLRQVKLTAGGNTVATAVSLTSGSQLLLVQPVAGLTANTTYTLTVAGIVDLAGNAMTSPSVSTFTTSAVADLSTLTVVAEDPANQATGVPLNALVHLGFSKGVNAVTLGAGNLQVYPYNTGTAGQLPGSLTVSPDGTNVIFTPAKSLVAETAYCIYLNGVLDLEGQALSGNGYRCFTTGTATSSTAPIVTAVTPVNGATGVPVNPLVQITLSKSISTASVGSSAISLSAGGTAVSGSVTALSPTTLAFTPASNLAVGTTYTLTAGGFTDLAGNAVTAFTSTFTTGSVTAPDTAGPTIVSVTPSNTSSSVAVTTPIVVTFSEPIDPLSINNNSINVQVNGQIIAGTYTVNGAVVTFTPQTSLPGSSTVRIYVVYNSYPQDLAGNNSNSSNTSFTTAATADTTAPAVMMVTPANGATGVGQNGQIVVLFSKSMNPSTLNTSNIALLAGSARQSFNASVSADNRMLVLSSLNLPASTVITLAISQAVTDLSGNPLPNFTSQFTTAAAFDTSRASVVSQRPANGATSVSVGASPVVLFVNKPLNASTVPGALHVSQNGQLVTGTAAVVGSGQTIQFTPSSPWTNGSLVQVFLDATASDLSGNAVNAYSGSFTVIGDPTTTAPTVVNYSPANGATGVPLNVVFDWSYSEALNSTSVSAANVTLNGPKGGVTATPTLDASGTIVHLTPASALTPNSQYCAYAYNLQGTNGKSAQNVGSCFTTGAAAQTAPPTVVQVTPADKLTGVPLNANISVQFSGPIDPLTVTGATIQVSGGGQTSMPASISFRNNNQIVEITPEAALPPSTLMALAISGVQDVTGNAVPAQTTHFTTGTSAATSTPGIVVTNPASGASGIPVNTLVSLEANAEVDGTTVNGSTFQVYDTVLNQTLAGSYSLSSDGMTVYFLPTTQLATGRKYTVYFNNYGMTDLAGNSLTSSCSGCLGNYSFTTGFATSTTAPQVTGISPSNGLNQVPINAQIVASFSEPVNGESLGAVVLSSNGVTVPITTSLGSGSQLLTVTPVAGLAPSTKYTLTIAGVTDLSGNVMTAPSSSTFTTTSGADLSTLTLVNVDPANNATSVPQNAKIRVGFSKGVNILSLSGGNLVVYPYNTGTASLVLGSVSVSPDGTNVTFTPTTNLLAETRYCIYVSGVVDLEGQALSGSSTFCFTTGSGTQATGPSVLSVSPVNAAAGVPVNATVQLGLSEPASSVSVTSGTFTVTTGGAPVAGTVSLANSGSTLVFTPTSALATGATYTVLASGFTDLAGNVATAFTSTFTTSTSSTPDTTGPSVVSVTPANGTTNIAVTTPVVVTFSEAIDPLTINTSTILVQANNISIAGTYAVNGAVVTFTPATPLPGSAAVRVYVVNTAYPQDFAGNNSGSSNTGFSTAATADTTGPTVAMVTPSNGTTGVGQNGQVVVTFSKSVDPSTLNTGNIALLAGDVRQSFNTSISSDNRTLVLYNLNLPTSTVITLALTHGVADLSGNALADFTSQFSTAPAFNTTSAKVVSQRPGNGATGVLLNASPVVLFVNAPLNASTVPGALHVSQNGQLVPGSVAVVGNGQTIQFIPSSNWTYGALVQVFLDTTATDLSGNAVTAYNGSFTVIPDPTSTAPSAVNVSPANNAANVPLNAVVAVSYSGVIDPTTVVAANVTLNGPSNAVASTLSLDSTGTIVLLTPSAALVANSRYCFYAYGLQGTNGKAAQNLGYCFTTGSAAQTAAPTVVKLSPANKLTNVPLNTNIGVQFSEPINPLTVNGSTILLTGGSQTAVPASISFSNNNQNVEITPQAPLPPSTVMTVTVSGLTDVAGNAVTTYTGSFTTSTAAATATPGVLVANPIPGAGSVPVNAAVSLQFNTKIDGTTINTGSYQVYDTVTGQTLAGTYSQSADGMTVYFLPSAPLGAGRSYQVYFYNQGMTDLAGNAVTQCSGCISNYTFTTGFASSTTVPQVAGVSPSNGLQKVPINAQIVVAFNEPVNAEGLTGVTLSVNGSAVALGNVLGLGNQQLIITPAAGLLPSSTYTLTVAGVTDLSGNAMASAVTSTFTTGTGADLSSLTVTSVDPASTSSNVALNAKVRVGFSKAVNTVSLGGNLDLYPSNAGTSFPVAGAATVSSDGTNITFTPSINLLPETQYCLYVNNVVDLEGQSMSGSTYQGCFITGAATQGSGPAVLAVSPANTTTGVPVNATVQVSLSEQVSSVSLGSGAITVTAAGAPVAGTVTLPNATTLVFTPSSALTVSTAYTVTVGGFTDLAGNAATAFTSTFTTGSSATPDKSGPSVVSVSPANGATAVAVTTPIVVTFSEAVNPLTIGPSTILVQANNQSVAGTYVVNGAVVTFTPQTPLPGSAAVRIYVVNTAYPQDLAGNNSGGSNTGFTTAATTDTTAPTVSMVTPANGSVGIGQNGQVVVVFSKSMNGSTLSSGNVVLLANDTRQNVGISVSADQKTMVLYNLNLPASTVVTLAISSGATDLSGNALAPFTSQFTTAQAFDTTNPRVVNQRPGNGATNVSLNAGPVVLFLNEPLNAASVPNAVHVSQNGQIVQGTVAVVGNGQTVQFTPSSPWTYGSLVQVFLDSTATNLSGNAVNAYKGSFTVVGDPAATTPAAVNVSPANNATGMPVNTVISIGYNDALLASTVNTAGNVTLNGPSAAVPATVTLDSTGKIIHITPSSALSGNVRYCFYSYNLQGVNGINANNLGSCFTTGTTSQTSAPTALTISPANKLSNVALNANIGVQFSVPVDPETVTGANIQVSGGGYSSMPASISFQNGNQTVEVTPEAPLPPSTIMTINVSGITDVAGNAVAAFTSSFTTGTAAATSTVGVLVSNPAAGATGVPLNAALSLQTNAQIDGTTVSTSSYQVYDNVLNQTVPGTYTLSADGLTVYFVPTTLLATGRTYTVNFINGGMADIAGNSLTSCSGCVYNYSFISGYALSTAAPQVTGVSPTAGLTQVPINALIGVAFNEPVNGESLGQITLSANGTPVALSTALSSGNQLLTITPVAGLLANTTYTLTVAGVADLSGNAMTTPATSTFTTSGGADLTTPTVTAITPPANATGVLTTAPLQIQFSKRMNLLSINSQAVKLTTSGATLLPATLTFDSTGTILTVTPTSALPASTALSIQLTTAITDLEGIALTNFQSAFTTGTK